METQSKPGAESGALKRHARAALGVAGALLAISLVAWAQSHPTYDTGEPTYPGDAPAYDNTQPPSLPLTAHALSAMSRLQNIRGVVDRAPDISPTRKAVALAEIDLAIYTLQNSNAPEANAPRQSHPIYDLGGPGGSRPAYDSSRPIYDNTVPAAPLLPSDRKSSAKALRQLEDVIGSSSSLSEDVRKRTAAALDAAAKELDRGR